MFREMRRNGQELPLEECTAILNRGTSGVLALSGDDNYPYAVPVSYAYDGYKLYFHCAKSGHKIDAIRRNAKASFCVIDQDLVVPEEYFLFSEHHCLWNDSHSGGQPGKAGGYRKARGQICAR